MSTTHIAQSKSLKSLKTRAPRGVRKSRRDEPKVESAQVPLPRKAAPTPVAGRDVRSERKPTKQQICLDLLRRPKGASIEELQAVTGWQAHSVRGLLAGAVKKKLGLTLRSEKLANGERRYRVRQVEA
jgi:hypothetical protein